MDPSRHLASQLGPGAEPDTAGGSVVAASALRHLRRIFHAVKAQLRQLEKQTGVGGALVWAMNLIGQHPGLGVGDLARRMDIHQSTASNLVKTLVERGMVETKRPEADRRAVQLHLRPLGQDVLLKASPLPFSGVLHDALNALDAPTLQRLDQDLGALADTLAQTLDQVSPDARPSSD